MISAFKRHDNWTLIGLLITLILMMALFSWQSEFFFTTRNFINIGQAISIRGLIAIGLTIVMITGGLDLSMAAVAAVAGMVTASLISQDVNSIVMLLFLSNRLLGEPLLVSGGELVVVV